jgi:energy-coupling factor transporter ATP-binding protein EcfA2
MTFFAKPLRLAVKIESIYIEKFKQFDQFEVSLQDPFLGEAADRFLIIGDNGSGKTSLLQAMALPLALATGKIKDITDFDWLGFLPGRYWARGTPQIEVEVSFEQEELDATREIARIWYQNQPEIFRQKQAYVEPGDSKKVKVTLVGDYWEAGNSREERNQFRGRLYAQSLVKRGVFEGRKYFSQLPGVFWFDQFRNLGVNTGQESNGDTAKDKSSNTTFEAGVGRLRQYLLDWNERPKHVNREPNYLAQLENLYRMIFPSRKFSGAGHSPSANSPAEEETYFLLTDGEREYDLIEMSAGEQSIFPILYEFVRQQIAHSVILIDEIDLNLHPPAAQYLVSQLLRIQGSCQYILTTHSDAVTNVISASATHRLTGGALCL